MLRKFKNIYLLSLLKIDHLKYCVGLLSRVDTSQPWADSGEVSEEGNSPTTDTSIKEMLFTLQKKKKKKKHKTLGGGHLNMKIMNLTSTLPNDIQHG